LILTLVVGLSGCSSGETTTPPGAKTATESTSADTAADIATDMADFFDDKFLETGTYYVDPDDNPSTPLRVVYEIAADGWSPWMGASKSTDDGDIGVSIATVTNLVRNGCHDNSRVDPPIGPTVDDLVRALTHLAPFRVTSPPTDVTIDGYRGKHLELTVPKIDFARCVGGKLRSWIAPPYGAFYGYSGPGYIEDFWIVDVEGSRLMIAAERPPDVPTKDMAEMRAILDSIQIEP
jgi:hypothetical protein